MAIKKWEVTAEINMDASRYKTVVIKANSERKALIFGERKLKEEGAFCNQYVCKRNIIGGISFMIHIIRSWFCKHEFVHIEKVKYNDCIHDTFMCKKCGWIRKIRS